MANTSILAAFERMWQHITAALNNKVEMATRTVTLLTSDWSDNTQIVTVDGATATNTVLVGSFPDNYVEYGECAVRCIDQGEGTLTFVCGEVPSIDIQVNVIFME